jgi:SAM-dependent methyltransferase
MHDVTKDFYEQYPFPSLKIKDKYDILAHANGKMMERILSTINLTPKQLEGKEVLEAGCGTGEKSLYFSLKGAKVTSLDISSSSLKKAESLAKRFHQQIDFRQQDILTMHIDKEFDYIFSMGVIHHTKDPSLAIENLTSHLKTGGCMCIGVYNLFGRLHLIPDMYYIRLLTLFNKKPIIENLKVHLLGRDFKDDSEKAYLTDTYLHPREKWFTIGELERLLLTNGFEIMGHNPPLKKGYLNTQVDWLMKRRGFFTIGAKKCK